MRTPPFLVCTAVLTAVLFSPLLGAQDLQYRDLFLFSESSAGRPSRLIRIDAEEGAPENYFIAVFPLSGSEGEENPSFVHEMVLSLLDKTREKPPERTIIILFLGEEDRGAAEFFSSQEENFFSDPGGMRDIPEHSVLWYMDIPAAPSAVRVFHGTDYQIAPGYVLDPFDRLCAACDIPYQYAIPYNEIYKMGLAEGPAFLRFVQKQGIGALYLEGVSGGGKTIGAEVFADLILNYVSSVKETEGNPDFHYSLIRLPGSVKLLSQYHAVFALIVLLALIALVCQLFVRKSPAEKKPARVYLRSFWFIPALLPLLFLALWGSGFLALKLFGLLKSGGVSILYSAGLFRLVLALALFFFAQAPLKKYSPPPLFFGVCAAALILLDTLVFIFLDLSFMPVFFFSLGIIFLGSLLKHPVPVYICALLAPARAVLILYFLVNSHNAKAARLLLSVSPAPVLAAALIILPYLLLIKRAPR